MYNFHGDLIIFTESYCPQEHDIYCSWLPIYCQSVYTFT